MRILRDSVAKVTRPKKAQKKKGQMPLVCAIPLCRLCSISLPRRNGGGGEQREPVGALVTDAAFLR